MNTVTPCNAEPIARTYHRSIVARERLDSATGLRSACGRVAGAVVSPGGTARDAAVRGRGRRV